MRARSLKSAALRGLASLALVALFAPFANAGTIIINNINAAGVGFNDPAPRAPVGGNPGTTLGQQRLFLFQHAANIWGSILPDNVTITIDARMLAQTCTATSATLASTSSNSSHRDFTGAPVAGHWYKQSLANKLFGSDLSASNDMTITFNANIDLGCFGPGQVWYYGFDGNEGSNIELLPTVLHEIGHGLGFATLTSGTTGNYASSFPDIYDKFLLDKTTGGHWDSGTTAAQRAASAIALDKLVWDGPEGVAYATKFLTVGQPEVKVNAPGAIAGSLYTGQDATFGAALTVSGFTGNVVLLTDDNGGGVGSTNPNDGCDNITNAGALAGNIALIDRGTCTFVAKCLAAQNAGATGVIIVNNVAAGLPGMGGTDPSITIPCIGISQADGNAIKAQLANGVNVTIRRSPSVHAGADNLNRPKMYTPNPFVSGSSVSHWDISLTPNALMEPSINADLHNTVDMTEAQLKDIGWFNTGGNIVQSQSTSTVICPSNPCVTLPVNIQRTDATPLLGYSVTFQLSSNLTLCSGTSSITEGTYLSGSGPTTFQVTNNGGGSYTVDGVVLGAGCGPTGANGNLFNVGVTSSSPGGTGQLQVMYVLLRDCSNNALPAAPGNIGGVPIDTQAPVVTVTSPNGGESWLVGSLHNITWTATDNVAVANVDLAYSTDGGATYPNAIATGIANSGSFAWTVPNTPTVQARVRVTAHDTGCATGSDDSNANFTIRDPIITATAGPNGSISPSGPVSVPSGSNQSFTISADPCYHIADVLVDGVSVGAVSSYTFNNVTVDHTISASFAINVYTIVASAGSGGSISPSGNVPVNCGSDQAFTIVPDACYTIADVLVDGVSVGAVASYTFTNVQANHTISASFTPSPPVAVPPVTVLAAAQVKTGNDLDGTTKTTITFTPPAGTYSIEVWRKGFGSYPTYDNGGGSVPATPGAYPPAGWTLTGVTASGQTDETTSRDYWYYVAYAKDACGNVSPVSNKTGGTLGYHLGDVSDGITAGQGNNTVTTVDVSLLGAHYGLSGGALAGFEYLDVGPTTDTSPNGRPTTDTKTDFEDLVMFAINYTPRVSLVAGASGSRPGLSGANQISVGAVKAVLAGEVFDVPVRLTGAGNLQAVSVALRWDARVVMPVAVEGAEFLTTQGGVAMTPRAGVVDAALLGNGPGMAGEGNLATVRFRALAVGDPGIGVERVVGRDAQNTNVEVKVGAPVAMVNRPTSTELQAVVPNPIHGDAVLSFSLVSEGRVDLSIYSVDGRRVRTVVSGVQPAGSYRFVWNGADDHGRTLQAGAYYVRFEALGVRKTRLVALVR